MKKVVVFAPHPDDETMGCGGTIAKRLRDGCEVLIVVMTDGRNAFRTVLGMDSEPTPLELKEIRKREFEKAIGILGVPRENAVFLDFEDGTLDKNEKEAEDEVAEILAKNSPDEIYLPYQNDHNPDHRTTFKIVSNSLRKSGTVTSTYQYSIAQEYSRIGPMINAFFDLWKHKMVHVDISDFLVVKRRALREYRSQVDVVSRRQQRPVMENIERFLKDTEAFFVG